MPLKTPFSKRGGGGGGGGGNPVWSLYEHAAQNPILVIQAPTSRRGFRGTPKHALGWLRVAQGSELRAGERNSENLQRKP